MVVTLSVKELEEMVRAWTGMHAGEVAFTNDLHGGLESATITETHTEVVSQPRGVKE
jgi:hypothetical protein